MYLLLSKPFKFHSIGNLLNQIRKTKKKKKKFERKLKEKKKERMHSSGWIDKQIIVHHTSWNSTARLGHELLTHRTNCTNLMGIKARKRSKHKRITGHRSRQILGGNQTRYQLGLEGGKDWRGAFRGTKRFRILLGVWVTWAHPFVNNIQSRFVHFNLCKIFLES